MMKHQQFKEPKSGKLGWQPFEGVMFTYDINLGFSKEYWKGLIEEHNSEKGLHHAFFYGLPWTWHYKLKQQ